VIVREVCSKDLSKGGHTVATLHDADLTEVVSTLSTPDVTTFIRDLVRTAFQELIGPDFATHIGALPHERTETHHPAQRPPDPAAVHPGG
jgi:hypothetical protein